MNFSAKLLPLLIIIVFSSMMIFYFSLSLITEQSNPMDSAMTKTQRQNMVDLESDQSFSGVAGSTIDYNIYIENKGKTSASYTLTALSNNSYYVEVWRDTDQIGSGDTQLIPPQKSTITMSADEVATLVVKMTIPSDTTGGTVDSTIIKAVNTESGASDSVTVTTTVASNLSYPSNWTQLGSDPTFPTPPPARIDLKAFYYTNNGTDVFFRMTEAGKPNTRAFLYSVYLDIKAGGQQIDSYNYDYLLSSDGILYEWNGTNWINSGYPTYWQVDGTGIVLWADLDNLSMNIQEMHFLACTTTKDNTLKDKLGPYTIPRNNISEIPLILIPLVTLIISFSFTERKSQVGRTRKRLARKHEKLRPTKFKLRFDRSRFWLFQKGTDSS